MLEYKKREKAHIQEKIQHLSKELKGFNLKKIQEQENKLAKKIKDNEKENNELLKKLKENIKERVVLDKKFQDENIKKNFIIGHMELTNCRINELKEKLAKIEKEIEENNISNKIK